MGERSSDDAPHAVPNVRRCLTRDDQGQTWTVREEPAPREEWTAADHDHHAHGYGVGWLIFERSEARKRLRLYPARWRTLPEPELRRLCDRARPCP